MRWETSVTTESKIVNKYHSVADAFGHRLAKEIGSDKVTKNTIIYCDTLKQHERIIQVFKDHRYSSLIDYTPGVIYIDVDTQYVIMIKSSKHDEMIDLLTVDFLGIEEYSLKIKE